MAVLPQKTCFSVHQFAAERYCAQKVMSRDTVVCFYPKLILGIFISSLVCSVSNSSLTETFCTF